MYIYILEWNRQGRIKVGAIDAAALGPFLKQTQAENHQDFFKNLT